MDRNRKRKADPDDGPNSASKRQKFQPETPDSTTQAGLKLIELIKNAKDKTGRSITGLFLTLPDKRELPEYYDAIKLPIAVDTVEKKLHRHEYPTLTTVESDVKRMVANAKLFNDDQSIVFADAERVRKLLSNWMKVHNPAYQDPDYTAFPTPIPDHISTNEASSATPDPVVKVPRKPTINLSRGRKTSQPQPEQPAPAPAEPPPEIVEDADEFVGKTFQQAQELIVQDLIDYSEEDIPIFEPFRNLPPRALVDYYKLIKKPTSLNGIKKRVQGRHGREAATGITDLKTWDAFEDEVSYIWKNAREYNEDGSDIYALTGEFEHYFKKKLAVAKAKIDEPQGPRISLKARPRPTIHLGAKGSPAPAQPSTPGVSVDNAALARQKQMVQAGAHGHQQSQPPTEQSSSSSQVPADIGRATSQPVKAQSPPAVKEETVRTTPAPTAALPASTGPEVQKSPARITTMPPPARLLSGSPHPTAYPIPPPAPVSTIPTYAPAPPTFIDNFSRTKPVSEALLTNLTITTHPQLHLRKPFKVSIPPHPDFTHQSTTILLPAAQYYLQITPTISSQLISGRQHKLFVTVNGVRVPASTKPNFGHVNGDTVAVASAFDKRPVYDAPLNPGVNRIEVEIVAALGRAVGLDTEKISVFANLMRA